LWFKIDDGAFLGAMYFSTGYFAALCNQFSLTKLKPTVLPDTQKKLTWKIMSVYIQKKSFFFEK
jgi:hypothetical protein